MKHLFLFLALLSGILYACDNDKTEGKDTPPNFQPTVITFDSGANAKTIQSSNNQSWWFDKVAVNDSILDYGNSKLQYEYQEGKEHNAMNVSVIKGSWFTLKKIDNKTISISVSATKENRKVSFDAYRGNSWQTITIMQYK